MTSPRNVLRCVVGMSTRMPFTVGVVAIIQGVQTNGTALKKALVMPDVQAHFVPEHVGIVRIDTTSHLSKDLDNFCEQVGVTGQEREQFKSEFASSFLKMIREIARESEEMHAEIPLSESRWGKP